MASQQVRALFDNVAPWYDAMNRRISLGLDHCWRRRAIQALHYQNGQQILDVATGTAELAVTVARRGVEHVVGVDFSTEMLALGRGKLVHTGLEGKILLVQGDALRLPFPANSFDAVLTAFALRNLSDIGRALAEMSRVVRPGGQLISLEITYPSFRPWKMLFQFYFDRIVPVLGRWWTGAAPAYRYLPDSLVRFPPPGEVLAKLTAAGWNNVRAQPLFPGTVILYTAVR